MDVKDMTKEEKEIIYRIGVVLDKKELTINRMAYDLDVTRNVIANITSYRSRATVYVIRSICEKYNISADWLLLGRGDMNEQRFSTGC